MEKFILILRNSDLTKIKLILKKKKNNKNT